MSVNGSIVPILAYHPLIASLFISLFFLSAGAFLRSLVGMTAAVVRVALSAMAFATVVWIGLVLMFVF